MDTVISLNHVFREDPQAENYKIKVVPIQDYRLIQVELPKKIFARKSRKPLVAEFQKELASLLDVRDDNYCVVNESLHANSHDNAYSWKELVPLREFGDYLERRWVERLLPYAVSPHFVVLGEVPYLPKLLCMLAPRMKSLLWIQPDSLYAEFLEEFAEDFYQEYGLAIDMRFPENGGAYGRLRIDMGRFGEPVNILDFVQNGQIPLVEPGLEGIWLDMASEEEKARRIEARKLKTSYFSLKKQWKNPYKTPRLIDTVCKNGYNTIG